MKQAQVIAKGALRLWNQGERDKAKKEWERALTVAAASTKH